MAGPLPIKFQEHLQVNQSFVLAYVTVHRILIITFSFKMWASMLQISDLVRLRWSPINLFVFVKKLTRQLSLLLLIWLIQTTL